MLQFQQSDTAAVLILTLTEKVNINDPYYLFVFTHVTTKDKVKFVRTEGQDESNFQSRYNQFTINAYQLFGDQPVGEWHYKVYENDSSSEDEDTAGDILEQGKMMLLRETDFEFTKYNEPQTFKTYNG